MENLQQCLEMVEKYVTEHELGPQFQELAYNNAIVVYAQRAHNGYTPSQVLFYSLAATYALILRRKNSREEAKRELDVLKQQIVDWLKGNLIDMQLTLEDYDDAAISIPRLLFGL